MGNSLYNDDDDVLEISGHGSSDEGSINREKGKKQKIDAEKEVKMAHMIQNERDRRLGVVRNNNDGQGQVNERHSPEKAKQNDNFNNSRSKKSCI